MSNVKTQFVLFPRLLKLNELNIKYQDAITYCTIRSFQSSQGKKCFPSYETIATRMGASRGAVIASIERLKFAGIISYVKIKKKDSGRVKHYYMFPKTVTFEKIPYEIFEDKSLTRCEKAILVCVRQFFNHCELQSFNTVTEMANYLGISYNTLKKQFSSLIAKGYITEHTKPKLDGSTNYYKFTSLINWKYDYENKVEEVPRVRLQVG